MPSASQEESDYDFDDIHQSYMDHDDEDDDEESNQNSPPGFGVALAHPLVGLQQSDTVLHRLSPIKESRYEREGGLVSPSFTELPYPRAILREEIVPSAAEIIDTDHGAFQKVFEPSARLAQKPSQTRPMERSSYWLSSADGRLSTSVTTCKSHEAEDRSNSSTSRSLKMFEPTKQGSAIETGSEVPETTINSLLQSEELCSSSSFTKGQRPNQPSLHSLSLSAIRSQLRISQDVSVETTESDPSLLGKSSLRSHAWAHEPNPTLVQKEDRSPRSQYREMQSGPEATLMHKQVRSSRNKEQFQYNIISDDTVPEMNASCPESRADLEPGSAGPRPISSEGVSSTIQGRYTSSSRVLAARQHLESIELRLRKYRNIDGSPQNASNHGRKRSLVSIPSPNSGQSEEQEQNSDESLNESQRSNREPCSSIGSVPIRQDTVNNGVARYKLSENDPSYRSGAVIDGSRGSRQLSNIAVESPYTEPDAVRSRSRTDLQNFSTKKTPLLFGSVNEERLEHIASQVHGYEPFSLSISRSSYAESNYSASHSDTDRHSLAEIDARKNSIEVQCNRTQDYIAPWHETDNSISLHPPPVSARFLRRSSSDPELSRKFVRSYGQDLDLPKCTLPKAKAVVEIIKKGNVLDTEPVVKVHDNVNTRTNNDSAEDLWHNSHAAVPSRRRSGGLGKYSPGTAVQVRHTQMRNAVDSTYHIQGFSPGVPTLDEEDQFPFPPQGVSLQYPRWLETSASSLSSRPCGTAESSLKKKRIRKSQIGAPKLVSTSSDLPTIPVQQLGSRGSRLKLKTVSINKKSDLSPEKNNNKESARMSSKVQARAGSGYAATGVYAMSLPKF